MTYQWKNHVRKKIINRWEYRKITHVKLYWKTTYSYIFAWGIRVLWSIIFVIQTRRSRALQRERRFKERTSRFISGTYLTSPGYCAAAESAFFKWNRRIPRVPPFFFSSRRAPVYFAEVMKGSKTWKNRRWSGWKKVNYFSPFVLSLSFCFSLSFSFSHYLALIVSAFPLANWQKPDQISSIVIDLAIIYVPSYYLCI